MLASPYSLARNLVWPLHHLRPPRGGARSFTREADSWQANPNVAGPDTTRIIFAGDLMAFYGERAPRVSPAARALFAKADAVMLNLEAPIVQRARREARLLSFRFVMSLDYLRATLDAFGIEPRALAVGLANNHIADGGEAGWRFTLETLRELGALPLGAEPFDVIETAGLRIGVIALTEWMNRVRDHEKIPLRYLADTEITRDLLKRARPKCDALIVMPHWGFEFEHFQPRLRPHVDTWAELGADLIVGHHSHVLGPVERRARAGTSLPAWSFYGLGNFYGIQLTWPTQLTALLEVELTAAGVASYRLHPFARVERDGAPYFAALDELTPTHRAKAKKLWSLLYPEARV